MGEKNRGRDVHFGKDVKGVSGISSDPNGAFLLNFLAIFFIFFWCFLSDFGGVFWSPKSSTYTPLGAGGV